MTTSTLSRRGVLPVRKDDIRIALLIVSLIGLYTQFHLYVGGRIVFPFLIPNLIGAAAFAHYSLKRRFQPAIKVLTLLILFVVSSLLMAAFNGYLSGALGKYSQILFSLVAGYGLCTLISHIERERLRKLLERLAWGVLIVAFAEVYLGFYDIMTQINSVLYSWRPQGFYTAIERDIALWGQVRPLVFSTEPSLVGVWGSVLMVGATILAPSEQWKRYLALTLYAGALFFVARSNTVLLIFSFYIGASIAKEGNNLIKQITILFSTIGISFALLFISSLTPLVNYAQGTSFFARITGPYLTTIESLKYSPFFGIGLGNDRLLEETVFSVWAQAGMLVRSATYVEAHGITGMLTNNFFWIWINFGLAGGVLFLILVFSFVRQLGRFSVTMILITTLGTWMTVGGFVDLRSWFFLYFFVACAISAEQSKINVTKRQS